MSLLMKTKEENLKKISNIKKRVEDNNISLADFDYIHKYVENNNLGIEVLNSYVDKLINGEPVQYIIGNVDFYGNIIYVNKDVLIPRFETELLVEKTIRYIKSTFNEQVSVLDIGTGSGAIAITINKETGAFVTAVDISRRALKIAQKNAKNNHANIEFIKSNLFSALKNRKFDLIISNPPYISKLEYKNLDKSVKNFEPKLALYGGKDGLSFYREIAKLAPKYLNENGYLLLEIGYMQAKSVIDILKENFEEIELKKDLEGNDRMIKAKKRSKDVWEIKANEGKTWRVQ